MIALVIGITLCAVALAIIAVVSIGPSRHTIDLGEDPIGDEVAPRSLRTRSLEISDRVMQQRRIAPFTAEELELAGIRSAPAAVFLATAIAAGAGVVIGLAVALTVERPIAWLLPVVLVVLVIVGARILISIRTTRRQLAFAEQLDDTLVLIAGGLRAGHSLVRALDAVSRDSDSPTAEEFARIVNENRLGRELGEAMEQAAVRMKSDDLAWASRAIEVHREVGGNLGEVLDHVAETIRERGQVKRQIATLSAEGRLSARVLIGLPVVVALILAVVSPTYISVFFTTPLGWALLGVSAVLFAIGIVWMRSVTRIDF